MTRYSLRLRTMLTLMVALSAVSTSQAGLFGRWRARYDNSYAAPATAPRETASPTTVQPAVSTAGPTVYTVAKPVITPAAASTAPAAQATPYVAPRGGYSSGGWSVIPRSSWDYGKFPPYSN